MAKEELYQEIDTQENFIQRYFGLSIKKFLFLVSLIVFLGVYLGIILYGTNSVEVLLGLEDYEHYMRDEVAHLKKENAELQREYFELKEISAQ